jgi:D-alanine--poly(phosphoribitol) ligase subunit 1
MELLEIDAALAALPGHRPAASVPLRRPNGTVARLVAYVAIGAGATVLPPELADWKALLAQRLPAYMIPSELRVCAQLPVSVNYKVDRVRLAQAYREGAAP